jgi:hypothetical protein
MNENDKTMVRRQAPLPSTEHVRVRVVRTSADGTKVEYVWEGKRGEPLVKVSEQALPVGTP